MSNSEDESQSGGGVKMFCKQQIALEIKIKQIDDYINKSYKLNKRKSNVILVRAKNNLGGLVISLKLILQ